MYLFLRVSQKVKFRSLFSILYSLCSRNPPRIYGRKVERGWEERRKIRSELICIHSEFVQNFFPPLLSQLLLCGNYCCTVASQISGFYWCRLHIQPSIPLPFQAQVQYQVVSFGLYRVITTGPLSGLLYFLHSCS